MTTGLVNMHIDRSIANLVYLQVKRGPLTRVGGWIAKHDCKNMTFLFYIDTFALQLLNLSSYLQDQLIWSYLSV